MCIICGCPTCEAEGALTAVTNEFNLISVETTQGGTANYKWSNDILGAESDQITWSMNLAGLSMVAGLSSTQFIEAVFDVMDTWAAVAGLNFQYQSSFGGADIDINVEPLTDSTIGIARTWFFNSDANGNGVNGMAARVREYLRVKGGNVVRISDADNYDYQESLLYYRTGTRVAAEGLAARLPLQSVKLIETESLRPETDARLVIGSDFVPYDNLVLN